MIDAFCPRVCVDRGNGSFDNRITFQSVLEEPQQAGPRHQSRVYTRVSRWAMNLIVQVVMYIAHTIEQLSLYQIPLSLRIIRQLENEQTTSQLRLIPRAGHAGSRRGNSVYSERRECRDHSCSSLKINYHDRRALQRSTLSIILQDNPGISDVVEFTADYSLFSNIPTINYYTK